MRNRNGGGERAMHKETDWFNGPSQKPAPPAMHDRPTMKRGDTTGVNKPVPETNSTRAPGQWGKS